MIKTEEFLLPAHWACYLINGDASGLTDAEQAEIEEWEIAHAPGPCIGCEDSIELSHCGDEGIGVCERAVYTFQVLEAHAVYSDGEVIAYH